MYRVLTITFAIYSQLPRCILCETTGHTSIYDFLKSQCYYEQWNCLNLLQKARTFQNTLVSLEPRTASHTLWKWSESRSVMSDSLQPHGLYSPWNSPGQNTRVGSLSLLQWIFLIQGSNPGMPYCRILYQLNHQGSPRILEWVVYPFSSRSFQPRNWTGVSCIAGGFFTNWVIRQNVKLLFPKLDL